MPLPQSSSCTVGGRGVDARRARLLGVALRMLLRDVLPFIEDAAMARRAARILPKEALRGAFHDAAAARSVYGRNLGSDRDFVLAAVKRDGHALGYASSGLRADREVVLAAVRSRGEALRWACAALQGDREIALAAVRRHGAALLWVGDGLDNDRDMVMAAAVRQCGRALRCAATPLREDPDVIRAARNRGGGALRRPAIALKNDRHATPTAAKIKGRDV